jgi:hypothetical protein
MLETKRLTCRPLQRYSDGGGNGIKPRHLKFPKSKGWGIENVKCLSFTPLLPPDGRTAGLFLPHLRSVACECF